MLEITAGDIRYGFLLSNLPFQNCGRKVLDCLWGETQKTQQNEECPLLKFRDDLEFQSPVLFNEYKELSKKIMACQMEKGLEKASQEQAGFYYFSLFALGTLYSANQKRFPPVSEELINRLIERSLEGKKFFNEIIDELTNLHSGWYYSLIKGIRHFQLSSETESTIDFLLKIFIEAQREAEKPLELLDEKEAKKLYDDIENFLKSQRKP